MKKNCMLVGPLLGENLGRWRAAGQRSLRATGCARYKREACARERPREGLPILRPVREHGFTTGVGSIELPRGARSTRICYQNQPAQSDFALEKFQGLNFSAELFSRSRARAFSLSRASLFLSLVSIS